MKHLKSDIPAGAKERLSREYPAPVPTYRVMACLLAGQVVGERTYTLTGQLLQETPLKNGQRHGREITWEDDGSLSLVEPYRNGLIHGTAKQYGQRGQVIGTYTFHQGTGVDIWRYEDERGKVRVAEIHCMEAGLPHGFEWWCAGPRVVYHERHWWQGEYHGIERMWNATGQLCRGYPKYWVHGQALTKRQYLRAAENDPMLPPWRAEDNAPQRTFPAGIRRLL